MALIKGISITLYEKIQSGTDSFNRPVYTESPVTVENVLVCPISSEDITDTTDLTSKKARYELCIPKGDNHIWENRKVSFFGTQWQTVGFVQQYIEENLPLSWNKKIKVESYG